MAGTFDAEAMSATAALIESATGIKIGTVDLTYMDGDQWPDLTSEDVVLGELNPSELGLFKAMVEVCERRDLLRKKITGIIMMKAGQRMASGEAEVSEHPLGMIVSMLGSVKDDLPPGLFDEQEMYDESYQLMNNMLFYGLRSRFKKHGDKSVGVRRFGKVVCTKEETK